MTSTPENSFKRAIAGGQGQAAPQIGLWLALADPYAAELCATAGFDWLLVDGEHGPNDLRSILSVLQAVAAYSSHPVVRIPHGDAALIKQVLELGATTLLVPMVETADQARALVRAMRYPPAGIRGVGSGLARSSRWTGYPNYVREANDRVCLLVQVESVAAVAQLDEIAAVDGVDGVLIGPADLAASMGHLGQPSHPAVRHAVEAALSCIRQAGKAPGVLAVDETLARRYIEAGARFIAVGIDATILAQATRGIAGRFKNPAPSSPGGSGY